MGKKKDKSKKGLGAIKTQMKTEKKNDKKLKKLLKERGEKDVQELIEEHLMKTRASVKATEEKIDVPSHRSNMTLIAHPDKDELIMFGGEFFNGSQTEMLNELLVYNIKNNEWTKVTTPNTPAPRSSHQMVTVRQGGGQLWMFGGEFASPSQSQFYHYKDLWVYHLKGKTWEEARCAGGPAARSGHRMVNFKKTLMVFGGFHDNLRECRYFNDLWSFDLETFTWAEITMTGQVPSPRSGCCMVASNDGIIIYGGFTQESVQKDVRGVTHQDMFTMVPHANNRLEWRSVIARKGGAGARPTPRCSSTMVVVNNNRAVLFGGVHDEDEDDEDVSSVFLNDMYSLDLEENKWHQISLRCNPVEKKKRRRQAHEAGIGSSSSEDEDEMDEEIADKLNITGSQSTGDGVFTVTIGPSTSQAPQDTSVTSPTFWPSPRRSALLAVKNGVLYVYGGVYEDKDKDITLSDMYSINLHKLDEWKVIIGRSADSMQWIASESETESSDETDDEDMDTDSPPEPHKNEQVEDYFSRNTDYWMNAADELAEKEGIEVTTKKLKKAAMKMAQEFFSSKQ